ncbi:ISL3 family transposase [Nonomuraea polychroma]|nr:ISL3 family transposase [Nonomuraea polychroma]
MDNVHVQTVSRAGSEILIQARTRDGEAECPSCATRTQRVHSRYRRRLSDVTCGGLPVVIELESRRLFCPNVGCAAETFAEQVPGLTQRHARRTPALKLALEHIALALAGRAGARLAAKLGITVSRSLLIRLLRALPDPEIDQVRVLGVDDFAKRRGHSYATSLVDLEAGNPIDVLDDRQGDTLAAWLRQHPGVEVICRDRAGSYAEGAAAGAPEAIQVADRFHLWKNLCDVIVATVRAHRSDLRESTPSADAREHDELDVESRPAVTALPESHTAVRTRERHAAVHDLLACCGQHAGPAVASGGRGSTGPRVFPFLVAGTACG